MSEEREPFLSRWSRLKSEAREVPAAPKEPEESEATEASPSVPAENRPAETAPLPAVNELTPESDFKPFMSPGVEGGTRRAALKKLFADSRFNVPDPFEAYSEDYTGGEPIPMEMLKTLNQARRLIFDEAEKTAQAGTENKPEQPPQDTNDGAGRKDA